MTSNASPRPVPKRQRIILITTDEIVIDQIGKNNNVSLLRQIILPGESNESETLDEVSKEQSSQKINKPKNSPLVCVICGSPANGYNFGAIACESCKAFFRRNARKQSDTLHCNNKSGCRITLETRRNCSACRLAKCFHSGMKCDRLLTVEQKTEKRRRIEENRNLALHSNSKTDEEEEEVPLSSPTLFDDLLPSIDTNIILSDLTDFIFSQSEQTLLNTEDSQRIEDISQFYENRIEFAARDGLPWDPSMPTKTFLQVLNSQSVQVMRLLSFFKQIPEFNHLNVDDRVTLIKSNFMTILGISAALSYNTETRELAENEHDIPTNLQFYPVLLGYTTCVQLGKIFHSFTNIAKYDRKILELTLIIFILTKSFSIAGDQNEKILNDNMSVYRAQNYYIELLWRYMEITHGYKKAIDLLGELTTHIMSWQIIHEQVRDNILKTLSPDEVNQLLPIMKSVLRIS